MDTDRKLDQILMVLILTLLNEATTVPSESIRTLR